MIALFLKQSLDKELVSVKVLMLLRIDQLLAVVVRNLGSKRVRDVLVKDLLEHHNGVVVVLYLAQLLAHIKLICHVKHVA